MKATGREISVWFVTHLIWWAFAAFIIYPFLITPLYQTLFAGGTSPAQRTVYVTVIGFVLAAVGWVAVLVLFLAMRGPGPGPTGKSQDRPVLSPILGPPR